MYYYLLGTINIMSDALPKKPMWNLIRQCTKKERKINNFGAQKIVTLF